MRWLSSWSGPSGTNVTQPTSIQLSNMCKLGVGSRSWSASKWKVGSGSTTLVRCECLKCGKVHPAPLLLQLLLYLEQEQFAAVKQNYSAGMSELIAQTLLQSARIFSRRSPAPSSSDSSRFSWKKRCSKIYSRGKKTFWNFLGDPWHFGTDPDPHLRLVALRMQKTIFIFFS